MKKKDKSRNFDVDPVDRKRKLSEKKNNQKPKKKSNNWQDWLDDEDGYI
jgi:hypothetical protein